MSVSTAPAAKAAIFAAVRAQISDSSVLVCYTAPASNDRPNDILAVGDVFNRVTTPTVMMGSGGTGWITEVYMVCVAVSSFRGGNDFQSTEWAAWNLIADIESAVRSDPSLGGVVIDAYPADSSVSTAWEDNAKGVLAEGSVNIRCTAQI